MTKTKRSKSFNPEYGIDCEMPVLVARQTNNIRGKRERK